MESNADDTAAAALALRARLQRRLHELETPEQRLACFVRLQRASFELLRSSPDGYQHFLRRNLASRRVKVIDGEWRTKDQLDLENLPPAS